MFLFEQRSCSSNIKTLAILGVMRYNAYMKYLGAFSKLSVFTTDEISGLFASHKTKERTLSTYVAGGNLVRVKRGLYAAINPASDHPYAGRFEIASKLMPDAYVAYHSALEYHGIANQVFNIVQVCSASDFRPLDFDGLTYTHVYPGVNVGVLETELSSVIRVTDLERTVIDCIDRIELSGGLEEIEAAIGACAYLNEAKLKEYLEAYDKNFLYQKAGYLLSNANSFGLSDDFFAYCKSKIGARKSYMTENAATGTEFNSDWNLFVPKKNGYGEE